MEEKEEVVNINFFKKVWYSITKFEQYPAMATEGFQRAIKYLVTLTSIVTIFAMIGSLFQMNKLVDSLAQYIEQNIPDFTVTDGKVSMDIEQPIIIENVEYESIDKIIVNPLAETDEQKEQSEADETIVGTTIFFFKDWVNLIKGGFNQVVKKEKTQEGRMFWYIVLATLPGGIIGFILDHFLEDYLTKPLIIAIALIVMGIILYLVDKNCKSKTDYEDMTLKQTFLIGLSQCLAFIPGVSRSGITMTAGRMMGVKREATAKYSFMLSAPIVLAATIFKLGDFIEYFAVANLTGIIAFILGVLFSFVVGILVIKFLLEYLKKGSFKIFAIYRIIVGLIVIAICIIR